MSREHESHSSSLATTRVILDLLQSQHGVASRKQLIALGLAPRMIDDRVAHLRLVSIFPGVYGIGRGLVGQKGLWLAATLSCGRQVALSHRSAAMLWGLSLDFQPIEVVSASMRRTRIDAYLERGLIVHQTRSLPEEHLTAVEGIRVTTVTRTLIDLAAVVSPKQLQWHFNEADRMKILDLHELAQWIESGRGRKGIRNLRKLVGQRDPRNQITRSELESMFLTLCSNHALPLPEVNLKVMGFEVDCYWPDLSFIVELDGLSFHSDAGAIERDHHRDAVLQANGYLVLRLTYLAVTDHPDRVAALIRAHLRRAAAINGRSRQLPAETSLMP